MLQIKQFIQFVSQSNKTQRDNSRHERDYDTERIP